MKIKDFLIDEKGIISVYLLNMLFINLVIILDVISVSKGNLVYINMVSFVIIIVFLVFNYINKNDIIKEIDNRIENEIYVPMEITENCNTIINTYNNYYKNYYECSNNKLNEININHKFFLDYISSWVHSVKTPISAAKLVIENDMEPDITTLNKIETELEEILHYTEQALYYSRLDSFTKDYLISEYNLNEIINKSVKRYSKIFISKKISVRINIDNIVVLSDNKWLNLIINQIIYNSLKYIDNGGIIQITTENKKDRIILKIRDNGCGIKEEDLRRVFDRGFTGYNGRKYEHSTGMGLYLAKKLCELIGHKIDIVSKYNEFTVVKLTFYNAGYYSNISKIR